MKKFAPRVGGYNIAVAVVGVAIFLLGQGTPAQAQVTPAHKVKVLLTALSFDRTLKQRAGDNVSLTILGSCKTASALKEVEGKAINGLPIKVSSLSAFSSSADLTQKLNELNTSVLFVCDSKGGTDNIASAAAKAEAVTLADDASWVEDHLALGVGDKDGRPELVLNVKSARSAGADFDARIFGVARVVK